MSKNTKRFIFEFILLFAVSLVVGLIFAELVNNKFTAMGISRNFFDPIAWLVVLGVMIIYVLTNLDKIGSGSKKEKKKDQKDDPYYQGRLFEDKDLQENFICCKYSELAKQDFSGRAKKTGIPYKNSGILVRNELINNGSDAKLVFLPPIHTLIIGNTNTGKSQGVILPTIQCYAEMNTHPNMIISDLKGELFRDTNHKLVSKGYNVMTFNLRDPFKSDRWNPLEDAYNNYQRSLNLKKEVLVHHGSHPSNTKLKFDPNGNFGNVWFEFDGYAYSNEEDLTVALNGKEQSLCAEITDAVTDIMNVIIPSSDPQNAMWEMGARDFSKAIIYSMLEDSKYPELGMTKEKFNFYNFYKIINIKDPGDKIFKTLGKYCDNRSKVFNAKELSNQVTASGYETATSFLSTLTPNISLFADPGIAYLTSGTDIDFSSFIKKPTALFLRIPDEKDTMYKLATIAIVQLYKKLVDYSNKYDSLELPRPTYFILDEFANLPKIEKMGNWVSVSRSRLIYFILAIQSYAQLETAYEKSGASTIKDNCNVHIFIGSDDVGTQKEISDKAGKTSVKVKNVNTSKTEGSKESGGGSKSTSESENSQERPLIFPEQLSQLPYQTCIVLLSKTPAFYSKISFMINFWKTPHSCYDKVKTHDDYRANKYLDENKVFYDIHPYIDKYVDKKDSSGGKKKNLFDDFNFDF